MKTIITALMLAACATVHGQRISALIQTNMVMSTNLIAVVVQPNATNGTRAITVGNLFAGRTLSWLSTNVASMTSGRFTNDTGGRLEGFVLITALDGSASLKRTNLLFSAGVYPGREITVCDGSATATGSNIWIAAVSNQTINSASVSATNINVNNGSVTLISDGSNWRVKCAFP